VKIRLLALISLRITEFGIFICMGVGMLIISVLNCNCSVLFWVIGAVFYACSINVGVEFTTSLISKYKFALPIIFLGGDP